MKESIVFSEIGAIIKTFKPQTISSERKIILQPLIDYIQAKKLHNEAIRLNFICTHNSRRSHLTQIWAQTLAYYFNIKNVHCYSGGTEVTALFPMIGEALKSQGFQILSITDGKNPVYAIKFAENEPPVIGFSKKLDDDFNPSSHFAAIMTCDSAKESCPIVFGAEEIFPVTYVDPKIFDQTSLQFEKYKERSLQIATELFYVFSQIR